MKIELVSVMKKIKTIFQGSYKFFFGMVLGMFLASGGVYAVTTIMGSNITYSNAGSGLSSTNVQGAIDELYDRVKENTFMEAYLTDEDYLLGNSFSCTRIGQRRCPIGTLIRYRVNSNEILNFRVLADDGHTIVMQSMQDIFIRQKWSDAFSLLIDKTANWNVNDITYKNPTSDKQIVAKARMITKEEAESLGCTEEHNSCPIWLKDNSNEGYWTMESAGGTDYSGAYVIGGYSNDRVFQANHYEIYNHSFSSVRAVVEVSKLD